MSVVCPFNAGLAVLKQRCWPCPNFDLTGEKWNGTFFPSPWILHTFQVEFQSWRSCGVSQYYSPASSAAPKRCTLHPGGWGISGKLWHLYPFSSYKPPSQQWVFLKLCQWFHWCKSEERNGLGRLTLVGKGCSPLWCLWIHVQPQLPNSVLTPPNPNLTNTLLNKRQLFQLLLMH